MVQWLDDKAYVETFLKHSFGGGNLRFVEVLVQVQICVTFSGRGILAGYFFALSLPWSCEKTHSEEKTKMKEATTSTETNVVER